jgi:hypothetical protein
MLIYQYLSMASFIYLMWDKRLEYLTSHPATATADVGLGVMGALAHLQWNVCQSR